jgi:hypothetical protein
MPTTILDAIVWLAVLSPCEPPLEAELWRFPPRAVARQAMEFNREYRRHVEGRWWMESHNRDHWGEVLRETDYLFHCWDWLCAAQGGEGRDEEYWRRSLREVRRRIGEEAYWAGQMPPAAPVWRFKPLR